jgi:uncharacterized protein DUF6968
MTAMFERDFEQASGGQTQSVKLEMFPPVVHGREWACRFTLRGGSFNMDAEIFGADSMQAAYLAMQIAATNLYASDEWEAGQLTWLGMRDLGMPLPKTFPPPP